ncbi:TPA: serine hydrolase [Legionella pneumophila subsp. pneumophila]|nr:serine hydrolase [Legionella pneumophila subsp. pneumophila]HAT9100875.1 serine hydrolase [Legionella pneumophila subsp. pneumophila]HAT9103573.1 serine hydrolase [Legionella pneumophila subsp. pneumophila]
MKKTGYLLMFVLVACFCNQKILAAIPLVELIAKPNPTQFVKTQSSVLLFYTLRNNTSVGFPLSYLFSSNNASLSNAGNTCGTFIGPNKTCQFTVQYQAPAISITEKLIVQVAYQGRSPVSDIVSINVDNNIACTLLNTASYQTPFCQQQYQKVLQFTPGVFNTTNQNVQEEQTLGGIFGLYQNTGSTEQICYISCGLRSLNGTPPNENTLFELASVTKTFTGSILGKFIINGTIASQFDEIRNYPHPAGLSFNVNEETVSFQQLATFSGGVCFSDAPSVNQSSTDQAVNQMNFITDINALNPDPNSGNCSNGAPNVRPVYATPPFLPTHNFYSNSSVGLLGQSLIRIDGFANVLEPDFNNWMCKNVTNPLDMIRTSACLPNEAHDGTCGTAAANCAYTANWLTAEYASGYHLFQNSYQLGNPFPFLPWAPAGGIRSNASDMIKFIRANLGFNTGAHNPEQAQLIQGMLMAHEPNIYFPGGTEPNIGNQSPIRGGQGYAWVCMPSPPNGDRICGKIGGHKNFRSFLGLNKSKNYGLIILFNTGALTTDGSLIPATKPPGISQIGANLLENVD